jgi:hypothetical protein
VTSPCRRQFLGEVSVAVARGSRRDVSRVSPIEWSLGNCRCRATVSGNGASDSASNAWRAWRMNRGPAWPKVTDDMLVDIITRTLEAPPPYTTQWTTRAMGDVAGLSKATISRIWRRSACSRIGWRRSSCRPTRGLSKKSAILWAEGIVGPQIGPRFARQEPPRRRSTHLLVEGPSSGRVFRTRRGHDATGRAWVIRLHPATNTDLGEKSKSPAIVEAVFKTTAIGHRTVLFIDTSSRHRP